jgi:hypothetical protein
VIPGLAFVSTLLITRPAQQSLYEAKMVCGYNDNHSRIFGEMLDYLNSQLQSGNLSEMAANLKMRESEVSRVASIEGRTLSMGLLKDNFSMKKDPFYIITKVSDPTLLKKLQEGLLQYLNNNPASRRNADRQVKKWKERAQYYRTALGKIDSLKEAIRSSYSSGNAGLHPEGISPAPELFRLSDSMSFYLSDCEYYLEQYRSVEAITDFEPRLISGRAQPIQQSAKAAAGAFFVLLILLTLINLRRVASE